MSILQEIWNSIDSLQRASGILQWVSFSLIFVGLLSGVSKYYVDQREKFLSKEFTLAKDSVQTEQVLQFHTTIKSLESELSSSKSVISDLEKRTVPVNVYKQLIRTVTATVEVIINSNEDVNSNFMDQGGYLAFAKGQDALLVVAATTCIGKQLGGNKVIYRGVFNLDAASVLCRK